MEAVGCVIITRDRPALAIRAIHSALAQTVPPRELVVVDGGSEPALPWPAEFDDVPGVRLLRLERTVGRGAARNLGMAALSSAWVAFLDDDDVWHPEKTRIQLAALHATPGIAALGTGFRVWTRPVAIGVPPASDRMARALLESFGLCTSTVIARREALLAAGGFAEDLERCEDWDLWLRLADRHELGGVPEILVERDDSRPDAAEMHDAYVAMR